MSHTETLLLISRNTYIELADRKADELGGIEREGSAVCHLVHTIGKDIPGVVGTQKRNLRSVLNKQSRRRPEHNSRVVCCERMNA